jgi:exopolysaccharide biosynthesis polyprenyl glycosylphosphotransferase
LKEREYYKRVIVFGLASLVIIALAALFGIVWYQYYRGLIYKPFWHKGNLVLIALYALIVVLFSRLFGGIRVGYLKRMDMIYTLVLTVLCANVVVYLQITLINRWFLPPWPLLLTTLADFVVIVAWTFLSHAIYTRLYGARKMLVIYGERRPDELIQKMQSRKDKYNICEKIHIDAGDQAILRKMREYEAVIIWDLPSQIRNRYLKYCFAHSIRCYITPKISDIIITGSDRIHLFDTPLLLSRNMGLSAEQKVVKRAMDILISGLGILITSPLMLVIALIVKLYDGGPVFYRQDRLSCVGREFRIFKFRSMCVDSEKNGARLASKNDSRITPVGHVLRNLHLDELPQLFNVFLGDMSLVGPRPERKEIMRQYQKEIPEFDYRLKVKAGLTGYAQVYGKYNTTPYDKLKLDLFYIENYSLMLDIKLIFMTAKIFFQKETSEGIEDDQVTALRSEEDESGNEG